MREHVDLMAIGIVLISVSPLLFTSIKNRLQRG